MADELVNACRDEMKRIRHGADQLIPDAPRRWGMEPAPVEPAVLVIARPLSRAMFEGWDTANKALDDVAGQVALLINDPRWSPAERERQVNTAVNVATETVTAGLGATLSNAQSLEAKLDVLGRPQRPQPVDALQYAELERLERTWTRTLDGIHGSDDVREKIGELLDAALLDGDALTAWALAGSGGFAVSYLEGRGWGDKQTDLALLEARVAKSLNSWSDPDAATARTLLVAFSDVPAVVVPFRSHVAGLLTSLGYSAKSGRMPV